MIALDTNVIVRVLIDDQEQGDQIRIARQFVKKHRRLFIPQIVQIELVWVLEAAYHLEKKEILLILQHLRENAAFILQNREQFESALQLYLASNVGFSDCLIQVESIRENCEVVTFDKNLLNCRELNYCKLFSRLIGSGI